MTGRRQGAAGDECCPHLASNSPRPDLRAGTFSPIPVPSHLPPASASYISHSFHLFLGQKLFIAQAEKRRGGWRGEDRAVEGVHTLSPSLPTPQTRAAPSPVPAARKQPSLPPLTAKGRAPARGANGQWNRSARQGRGESRAGGACFPLTPAATHGPGCQTAASVLHGAPEERNYAHPTPSLLLPNPLPPNPPTRRDTHPFCSGPRTLRGGAVVRPAWGKRQVG